MPERKQATQARSSEKRERRPRPAVTVQQGDLAGPAALPTWAPGLAAAAAAGLDDRRLPAAQRRALAARIGLLQGNHYLQRAIAGAKGERAGAAVQLQGAGGGAGLSARLGFASAFEGTDYLAISDRPLTANVLAEMRGLLVARFVDGDQGRAGSVAAGIQGIVSNLRRTVRAIGVQAPQPASWQAEELVVDRCLGRVEGAVIAIKLGSYSAGREHELLQALRTLDRALVRILAPAAGPATAALPGGSVSRKLYLGSAVVPGAVLNWYLGLTIQVSSNMPEGTMTEDVGMSIDEEGSLEPSASASLEGPAGAKVTGGVSGAQPEPSAGVSQEIQVAGGGKVEAGAQASSKGPEASIKVTDAPGWSNSITGSREGITFKSRSPDKSGVELSGTLGKATLTALAPELTFGDQVVQVQIEVEMVPLPGFFGRTVTQRPEAIRAYQQAVLISTGVLVAVPLVTGAAAATLPAVVVEFAPQALALAPAAI